ncbi:hypothetical protein YM304_39120 [Ilumatobacter coccineus YM16-304]|uniref:YtkA-like domain-containing protein n=1 Tax=Ilumatobacter coccineus (strain NBRC 103263 / KCTC 29153 / YM16-304) TaxID=1313172 RepID=A0A6C7EJU9_ILUCY|nr:hypothetical protein YM304_39120 [Ilumatobacter coccineus YM16-304]
MAPKSHDRIARLTATLATVITLLICVSAPASAGGWAVGSLDAVPAPSAGETVEIGFTILQHGVTPADLADDVGIEIIGTDGMVSYFAAEQDDTVGHYTASVTFPTTAGEYEWNIRMGWFGPQELGSLNIAPDNDSTTITTAWPTVRWIMVALIVALGAVAVSSLAMSRRNTPAVSS